MKLKTPTLSTVTAGGTSQVAAQHNPARRYLLIQNTSAGDLWVNYGKAAAAASPSIRLEPTDAIHFASGFAPEAAINIFGATNGQSFTLWEG